MDMASDSDTSSMWSNSSSAVTRTTATTSGSPRNIRELDPLLKDLSDKKQSFRSSVVSLAAELKEVRSRLGSKEQYLTKESLTRQEAEAKARKLEEEMGILQKSLDERNRQLEESATTAQQYLKELDNVKSKLATTQAIAEASSAAAQSAQFQCIAFVKELDAKDNSLKEHEARVNKLAEQLALLQKELSSRQSSQNHMKAEVSRIEADIMQALAEAGTNDECHLRRLLEEISPRNLEHMNRLLKSKDDELAKLKEAIGALSSEWRIKNKDLESQLEKHRKAQQDLKKRVLKLEFCLQEARAQTRKLQRMGERRDKAIKEQQDRLSSKDNNADGSASDIKQKIWERPSFKVVVSMSMLILVVFSKR